MERFTRTLAIRMHNHQLIAMVLCAGMVSIVFAENTADAPYEFHSTNVAVIVYEKEDCFCRTCVVTTNREYA